MLFAKNTHLETFVATRHGCEHIVRVHGAHDERRPVPLGGAETAAQLTVGVLAVQALHAHSVQEQSPSFIFHLRTRGEEKVEKS